VGIIIRGFVDDEDRSIGEGSLLYGNLWDILEFRVGGKSMAFGVDMIPRFVNEYR
jgi:hypothetical protein